MLAAFMSRAWNVLSVASRRTDDYSQERVKERTPLRLSTKNELCQAASYLQELLARDLVDLHPKSLSEAERSTLQDVHTQLSSLLLYLGSGTTARVESPAPSQEDATQGVEGRAGALNGPPEEAPEAPLCDLLDALVCHVLHFLPIPDIVAVRATCRSLRGMASSRGVWRPLCVAAAPWVAQTDLRSVVEENTGAERAHYDVYTRLVAARELAMGRAQSNWSLEDMDLCVDLVNTGTQEILYSVRGRMDASLLSDMFEFQGWALTPDVVSVNSTLLFPSAEAAFDFYGEAGPLQLYFTVIDRRRKRMAELSTFVAGRRGTRCSLGWDSEGQQREQELWLFKYPDAFFSGGTVRLLRGLTLQLDRVPCARTGVDGSRGEGLSHMISCRVVSAWLCDHQSLDVPRELEALRMFDELRWV